MPDSDLPHHQLLRFARIRRTKWLLRYMPRRARFHTYPLVGRFAAFARSRSFLWSFQYPQVRVAIYLGSVLTLLPVLGQVPIAFGLCLLFRTNFMILGGLQFASNLLTFPFILWGTYHLGTFVLGASGLDSLAGLIPPPSADPTLSPVAGESAGISSAGLYVSAFTIGGLLAGLVLGAVLDLLWRLLVLPAVKLRAARRPITASVTPHDLPPSAP
jgi:uncharacterized protein (DUF2062 family)